MNELDEIIVGDCEQLLRDAYVRICSAVESNKAPKSMIYQAAIKLQVVLGSDALERRDKRHAKAGQDGKDYFANRKQPADAPDSTAPRPCLVQGGRTAPESLGGAEFNKEKA